RRVWTRCAACCAVARARARTSSAVADGSRLRGALASFGWGGRGASGALVREVLGEPDGAGGVPEDGDADVGEGAAEDVLAVTVVRWPLVEHGLGQADRHPGDGRGVACHWAALADVLTGRCPVDSGGGLAGAEIGFAGALVRQAAAARHRRV